MSLHLVPRRTTLRLTAKRVSETDFVTKSRMCVCVDAHVNVSVVSTRVHVHVHVRLSVVGLYDNSCLFVCLFVCLCNCLFIDPQARAVLSMVLSPLQQRKATHSTHCLYLLAFLSTRATDGWPLLVCSTRTLQ